MKPLYFLMSLLVFVLGVFYGIANVSEISKGEMIIALFLTGIYVLQVWKFIEDTPMNPDNKG